MGAGGHRVRLPGPVHVRGRGPFSLVAGKGARLLQTASGTPEGSGPAGDDAWAEVVEVLFALGRGAGPAVHEDGYLSRLCVVLGWYEALYRMGAGHPSWAHSPLLATPVATLTQLLGRVDDRVPVDVDAMVEPMRAEHPALLAGSRVELDSRFPCSGDLGGADTDLVVDGLLLELKTSKRAQLLTPLVYQVLGYLLADTDDRPQLTGVGIYFARYGFCGTSTWLTSSSASPADRCCCRPPGSTSLRWGQRAADSTEAGAALRVLSAGGSYRACVRRFRTNVDGREMLPAGGPRRR